MRRPIVLAFFLTFAHAAVLLCIRTQGSDGWIESFLQWDSAWYRDIALYGYRSTLFPPVNTVLPAAGIRFFTNTGFFPAYPLLARTAAVLLFQTSSAGLLIVSWFATWGFWTYLISLLRSWKASAETIFLTVCLIVAHPSAFYLFAGYSESLFLFAALGWLYWSNRHAILAAMHGLLMTATRITGIVLAPILVLTETRRPRHILIACIALLGAGAFFVFCARTLGQWNLYFAAQAHGWDTHPKYFFPIQPYALDTIVPFVTNLWGDIVQPYHRASVVLLPITSWLGIGVSVWAWKKKAIRHAPVSTLLLAGWIMQYVHIAGTISVGFRSMARHTMLSYIFFVLAGAFLARENKSRLFVPAGLAFFMASGTVQIILFRAFGSGLWVA